MKDCPLCGTNVELRKADGKIFGLDYYWYVVCCNNHSFTTWGDNLELTLGEWSQRDDSSDQKN